MIKIQDTAAGSGPAAKAGDNVELKYKGSFPDGKVFDQGTFSFRVGSGQVIQGFDLGVTGMQVGSKRTITVPPELGYGSRGASNVIPPNATLVFEVELLDV